MKAIINRQLATVSVFDSASLGLLGSVAHQFAQPGRYHVSVRREGQTVCTARFEVSEESAGLQLTVDLARGECCPAGAGGPPVVSPKGYVMFYASSGTGGYAVKVSAEGPAGAVVFDSEKLGRGDVFALSPVQPGSYSAANRSGGAQGEITVAPPPGQPGSLRGLPTQYVEAFKDRFEPAEVHLTSTQGLVFRVQEEAHLVIVKREAPPEFRAAVSVEGKRRVRFHPRVPPAR